MQLQQPLYNSVEQTGVKKRRGIGEAARGYYETPENTVALKHRPRNPEPAPAVYVANGNSLIFRTAVVPPYNRQQHKYQPDEEEWKTDKPAETATHHTTRKHDIQARNYQDNSNHLGNYMHGGNSSIPAVNPGNLHLCHASGYDIPQYPGQVRHRSNRKPILSLSKPGCDQKHSATRSTKQACDLPSVAIA
jgi:hypothetical protein